MAWTELIKQALAGAVDYAALMLHSPQQIVAYLSAAVGVGLVIAGAFVRTMMPLRWLAVGSNLGLAVFGALHPSPITLVIAVLLLPINIYRATEVTRLTRRVTRAQSSADMAGLWLKPYMKARRLKAGETLFSKGDAADRLFLLATGRMELADIGQPLEAGRIFGEIALFSPSRTRTHTVRCVSPCTVLEIHETTVKQLYYQNPAFGFHLIALLAGRLSADIGRGQANNAALNDPSAPR
jgi:hypothetical protein